ncbi:MAG: DNA polymerase III subunit delta [bacterium]|nr:DNA polymerase III subunit delta [bacterium]
MATRARTRPASAVLRDVRKALKDGWPIGLTVLTGDDLFHLDRAQHELLEQLVPEQASDFALTVFSDEKVDVGTVISAGRSVGMFDTRRVVFVRELSILEGEADAIADYAAKTPPDSFIVVRAVEIDRRRNLHKALLKHGTVLQFDASGESDPDRLLADVISLATERGLKVSQDVAAFLAAVCLGDLYRVSGELDKLRAWLGGEAAERNVTLEQAREVAAGSGLASGWELADAVLVRDRPRALALARRLVDSGDEPIRIVGALAYRTRVMLQAKGLLAQGVPRRGVIQSTRSWRYGDQLIRGVGRYSLDELLRFPSLLLHADRCLKSRSLDPRWVLEGLVEEMTAPTAAGADAR